MDFTGGDLWAWTYERGPYRRVIYRGAAYGRALYRRVLQMRTPYRRGPMSVDLTGVHFKRVHAPLIAEVINSRS